MQNQKPSSTSDSRMKVVNTVDVPRGGWRYTVLDTGVTITAGSIHALKRDVLKHMSINNLEIPKDMDANIEDAACQNLEGHMEHWCQERSGKHDSHAGRPRWRAAEVLRFLKTIWNWGSMGGFKFVPMTEAERRAKICSTCPMNTTVSGCLGCSGVATLVKKIRGDHRTTVDGRLNVCDVCGCELKVKVLVPSEVIDNRGLEYPSWCWQNAADEQQDHSDHESGGDDDQVSEDHGRKGAEDPE